MNAALPLVPANLYLGRSLGDDRLRALLLLNAGLALLLVGTMFSWRVLANGEYRKIRGGAEFIRAERAREGDGATT